MKVPHTCIFYFIMIIILLKELSIQHLFEKFHFGTPSDFEKFGTNGIRAKNYEEVLNHNFRFLPYTAKIRLNVCRVYIEPIEPIIGSKNETLKSVAGQGGLKFDRFFAFRWCRARLWMTQCQKIGPIGPPTPQNRRQSAVDVGTDSLIFNIF